MPKPQKRNNAVKTAKKGSDSFVIQNLVIRPANRSIADIGSWRNALRSADYDRRTPLYDLYEDLMLDAVLSAAIDKRVMAITNAELTFQRDGKSVDEIDDLIDTPAFEDMLREIMLSKFWGITLLEFDFTDGFQTFSIPRKHIRPWSKQIAIHQSDPDGISYEGDDFFLQIGSTKDLGLILKAAPYAIYKRGGFGDWAQFVELFGMPFRLGKYNPYDDNTRQLLEQALDKAGSAAYMTIPNDSDVAITENKTNSNGELYNRLRSACNEEILITVLGQTMTTLDGSSRSQSETHAEVEDEMNKSDRRFVQRILNRNVLPLLQARGYPVTGGWFHFVDKGKPMTLAERLSIDERLAQMVDIEEDYFYETYGVPKPKKKAPEPDDDNDDESDPDDQDELSDKEEDSNSWKMFMKTLRSFFVQAPEISAGAMQNGCCGNHLTLAIPDGNFSDDKFIRRVADGGDYWDADLFFFTADTLLKGFKYGYDQGREGSSLMNIGFEYGVDDPALLTAFETNLFRFSAAKTLAEVQELNRLYRESKNFDDFYRKASKQAEVFNKDWLKTEYNTAYLTGESTATYHRLGAQTDVFPYWEYRSVNDDKVRPWHRELNGIILPANDPRWKKIYPPNDWNCRCYVVAKLRSEVEGVDFAAMRARVDAYFKTAEFQKSRAQGWGVNRASLGEVFTANQMYIRKFAGNASKYLDKLNHASYGLPAHHKIQASRKEMPKYSGEAGSWFDTQDKLSDTVASLNDYLGRNIAITEDNFRRHTTGRRKQRVEYLDALSRIIAKPDEVWINNGQEGNLYDNYVFIGYYNDEIVICICRLVNGLFELRTWFPVRQKRSIINRYRRGLLIKK